jgi:SAM-dependent methyltransferase
MKINIGAGGTKLDGYVTIDYDALENPDHVLNVETDTLPFDDNSVDTVVAHHILEHLGEGYFHCLQEIYRVCEHGAIVDIRVPHHRHDHFHDDPTHRRPITHGGLLLFSKKYNQLCRDEGAASSRLGDFYGVDFEIIMSEPSPAPEYRDAFNGMMKEEAERYINEHCNIITEMHFRLVVIKE